MQPTPEQVNQLLMWGDACAWARTQLRKQLGPNPSFEAVCAAIPTALGYAAEIQKFVDSEPALQQMAQQKFKRAKLYLKTALLTKTSSTSRRQSM